MLKRLFIYIFVFFFAVTSLMGEEKKEEPKKPKVKTGVEVEKGNKSPDWETQILKKKKEALEQKKEIKKEMKKEKKERKIEEKKERKEKRSRKGK